LKDAVLNNNRRLNFLICCLDKNILKNNEKLNKYKKIIIKIFFFFIFVKYKAYLISSI